MNPVDLWQQIVSLVAGLLISFAPSLVAPPSGSINTSATSASREKSILKPHASATAILSSVSPSTITVGEKITLEGEGFIHNSSIMLDNKYMADMNYTGNLDENSAGTSISFNFPAVWFDTTACAGSKIPCTVGPTYITSGQHTISLKDSVGLSNALPVTIQDNATFSIDSTSLTSPHGQPPVITGSANGILHLRFLLLREDSQIQIDYDVKNVPVKNGRWAIDFAKFDPVMHPIENAGPFPAGAYYLSVNDDDTGVPLTKGDVTLTLQ